MSEARLTHNLAAPSAAHDLAAVVKRATTRALSIHRQALPLAASHLPKVFFTFTDSKYESAFSNMLNAARAALMVPLVAALDEGG